jgi:hypothetical protein
MCGSRVIGIPWETIGSGTEVIGLGRHTRALVGWLLAMSVGNTTKVTGKETVAGLSITTNGTMIETVIIVRKIEIEIGTGIGIGTTIIGSRPLWINGQ